MPPFLPALGDAALRSDNWTWLNGSQWSVQDSGLYDGAAEAFQITDYKAGYFFGKSTGQSDPFWVSGDVAPDGSLYIVFTAPNNPFLTQCGLIAQSFSKGWHMTFDSYPPDSNGPTDYGYALLTGTNSPTPYSTILKKNESVTGVRGYDANNNVLLTGSYLSGGKTQGMWWLGSLDNGVGAYYKITPKISNETVTSSLFYGPNTALFNPSLGAGNVRIVGSYQNSRSTTNNLNHGLIYTGPLNGQNGTWTSIDVTRLILRQAGVITNTNGIANTIPHSTMGNLVVGNYDMAGGLTNTGNAFIYNIASNSWTIFSPTNSGTAPIGTTAYGIWQNGSNSASYTIAGGALTNGTNTAFLVDYNSATGSFSNLTYFADSNVPGFTHFEGITAFGNGYNLVATTANGPALVSIDRTAGPVSAFGSATWTPINYPGSWLSTGNTVFKNYALGIYFSAGGLSLENSYVVRIGPKPL